MVELQRQFILDPDAIPEPLVDDARTLRPIALRLSAVMGVAALIAWGVVSLPGMKKAGEIVPLDEKAPALAVNPVTLVPMRSTAGAPQVSEGFVAMNDTAPVSPESPESPVSSVPPVSSISPVSSVSPLSSVPSVSAPAAPDRPMPSLAPPPAAAPSSPQGASTVPLAAAEIATMVKRGKDFLMSGDIASARLLLRRAADGGSAEAALALGATFDPLVIRRLGAVGMTSDIAQARQWYQRAADLGSAAAMGQLAKLEQAQ